MRSAVLFLSVVLGALGCGRTEVGGVVDGFDSFGSEAGTGDQRGPLDGAPLPDERPDVDRPGPDDAIRSDVALAPDAGDRDTSALGDGESRDAPATADVPYTSAPDASAPPDVRGRADAPVIPDGARDAAADLARAIDAPASEDAPQSLEPEAGRDQRQPDEGSAPGGDAGVDAPQSIADSGQSDLAPAQEAGATDTTQPPDAGGTDVVDAALSPDAGGTDVVLGVDVTIDAPSPDAASPPDVGSAPDDAAADAVPDAADAVPDAADAGIDAGGGRCGAECPAGTKACGDCVPGDSPLHGCAGNSCSCPSFAHANAVCAAGACAMGPCFAGWADANQNPKDGCEADLSKPQNCGTVGNVCAQGKLCSPTGCVDACTPPLTQCGSSCVALATSPTNCGSCNLPCGPQGVEGVCQGGTCTPKCPAGMLFCSGRCADPASPATCGSCGLTCAAPAGARAICTSGTCGFVCAEGFTDCGGACVDTQHDNAHCGGCGPCAGGLACMNGQCASPPTLVFRSGLISVGDLAVDGGYVYWTDLGDDTVNRVAQAGGTTEVLGSNQNRPLRLAFDDAFVYWSSNLGGAIMKVSKAGGMPQVAAPATEPWGVAVDAQWLYWSEPKTSPPLRKAPKTGGPAVSVPTFSFPSTELELAGGYLVHGDSRVVGGHSTEVWVTPLAGGLSTIAGQGIGWAADAERVFMSICCNTYGVRMVGIDGSSSAPIVDDGLGPTQWLGLDADFVYWYRDGTLRRAPKCGGPAQHYAVPIDQPIFRLAVDDQYVYWSTTTTIGRLRK